MGKKLTYEEVKKRIESADSYKLLSEKYIESKYKLEIQCPKGHIFKMRYNDFHSGVRCPICKQGELWYYSKYDKPKAQEFVKNKINEFGFELLNNEYKNQRTLLELKCKKGHLFKSRYYDIVAGHGCPKCENILRYYMMHGKKDESHSYIKKEIEKYGYKIISDFKGAMKKVTLECPKKHIFDMVYATFQQGHRCPLCSQGKMWHLFKTGKKEEIIKFIKREVESDEGFKLLSDSYEGASTKIKIQCPEDHIFDILYSDFRHGHRCPICAHGDFWYYSHYDKDKAYQMIKEKIESVEGFKLISKNYIDTGTKIEIQCPEGHLYKMTPDSFIYAGNRCPECNIYRNQLLMIEFIRDLFPNDIVEVEYTGYNLRYKNTKSMMKFDSAVPSYNLALEYQGEQHYEPIEFFGGIKKFEQQVERDNQKRDACKQNGIILIEIPYTWNQTMDYILDMIEESGIQIERKYTQSHISEYE